MKHVAAWLLFFVALWWLWLLLAGEWNRTEWIAAAGAAAIGATIGEIARTRARAAVGLPRDVMASIPSALLMVFIDFGIVMWALLTGAEGSFRHGSTRVARNASTRAWAAYVATFSPNAYVLDIDREGRVAETHHLIPFDRSQDPV